MKLSMLPLGAALFVACAATTIAACGGSNDGNGTIAPEDDAGAADAAHDGHTNNPPPAHDAGTDGTSPPPVDGSTPPVDGSTPAVDGSTPVDGSVGMDAGTDAAPPSDGGVAPDAGDHGAPSSTYPAFPVDYPQVVKGAGTPMKNPVIVTITWDGDPNVATWDDYGDKIGGLSDWSAAVGEYGVGAASSGPANHLHLGTPPATITDQGIADLVQNGAGAAVDGGPQWPAPTPDTIYAVFVSPKTKFTSQSGTDLCNPPQFGGYHDNVVVNGKPVAYAVMPQCSVFTAKDIEETASHEYIEAATDPSPSYPNPNNPTQLGYVGFDDAHLSWDIYTGFQDELGDACEFWDDSYYQETGAFPYWLSRGWSNKGALEGHNPCAPQPTGAYEGMTLFPAQESTITIDLTAVGDTTHQTKGFHAAVGQSVTFQVGFFSDADTGGPWTITYDFPADTQLTDNNNKPISNGTATVTIDKTSGQNGEKAYVTVTPTKAGQLGFQSMAITWSYPGQTANGLPRYLPILISNN